MNIIPQKVNFFEIMAWIKLSKRAVCARLLPDFILVCYVYSVSNAIDLILKHSQVLRIKNKNRIIEKYRQISTCLSSQERVLKFDGCLFFVYMILSFLRKNLSVYELNQSHTDTVNNLNNNLESFEILADNFASISHASFAVYIFARICLSVCMHSADTFGSSAHDSSQTH